MARAGTRFVNFAPTHEAPSGTINGSNTAFTLASTPITDFVLVYLDGVFQRKTTDYSISGTTITMVTAPALGQDLRVFYIQRT